MNERIHELGKEATKWCCHNFPSDDPEWESKWEQKFAELIIQQCISQIALIGISNYENDDISWAVDLAIDNIRERFDMSKSCCNGNCNQGRDCHLQK